MPLYEKSKEGTVYIALYVDDNFMTGNPNAIDGAVKEHKNKGQSRKGQNVCKIFCCVRFSYQKIKGKHG